MFERYNEPARRSLFFSRYEASVLGSHAIQTEHLLLGLLREREPLITHLLSTAHVTADAIRQLTYAGIGAPAGPLDTSVEIPFSKDSKHVLAYTGEESDRLLHHHIGLEHLLLGLLRHERGVAWDVLQEKGLNLTAVREALVIYVSAKSFLPPEIAGMLAGMAPGSAPRAHRARGIYLMTVLDAPSPGRRATADDRGTGTFSSFSTVGFSTLADSTSDGRTHAIGPISMSAVTLTQFALVLEAFLDASVMVDDAAMGGSFDIELQGTYDNEDALIAALRDQLGLALKFA